MEFISRQTGGKEMNLTITKVQQEILKCLVDNYGEMTFDNLKFELSSISSPQGLGRSISTMNTRGWVNLFPSWNDEPSVDITRAGEEVLRAALTKTSSSTE
jgi:hypothetical protein